MGGDNLSYLTRKLQKVINDLANWGSRCGLTFSPEKTVAIIFTRKKIKEVNKLKIYGKVIEYQTSTKYLGLTLDSKLNWTQHINNVLTSNLAYLRRLINKTKSVHGPKPKLIKWAYTGIIRPRVSYGVMIWGNKLHLKKHDAMLTQLNRTAIKGLTKFKQSTPTAALEIITDIIPLKLHLLKTGMTTYCRLKSQLDRWKGKTNSHKILSHLEFWEKKRLKKKS